MPGFLSLFIRGVTLAFSAPSTGRRAVNKDNLLKLLECSLMMLLMFSPPHSHSYINSMELSLSWEAASPSATQEFPNVYGTRRFITVFTRAHHCYLSSVRSIQSTPPHPNSQRYSLIPSCHLPLGLRSGSFPSDFHTKILYAFRFSPCVLHALPISLFYVIVIFINNSLIFHLY
jgi:hypothetical protein